MQTYPENQWPASTFNRAIDLEATRRAGVETPTAEQFAGSRAATLANWLDLVAPAGTA